MNAFTLWLPKVRHARLSDTHPNEHRIIREDGTVAAYQCGNAIGIVNIAPVHRMGRRDA